MIPHVAARIRAQMDRFSGNLSEGLGRVLGRLVREVVYGICARQSVHLSEIGRALDEPIPLLKTETRLSRNLGRDPIRPVVQANIAQGGAGRLKDDTLLVLDLSDLVKPYARCMEHLARVRDGSRKVLANGYWLCQVIGVECGGCEITPLYADLYSSTAPDFVSENDEIMRALRTVEAAASGRGIWVIDRGGDRGELFDELVPRATGRRFVIRLRGDRHLLAAAGKRSAVELARDCPLPYATAVWKEESKRERAMTLQYGFRRVRLPAHPGEPLWLVVVRGLGDEPLMLLTNVAVRRNRAVLWWLVEAYLTRWRIEETIRFTKQSYRLEDIRVRSYQRLRNLVVLTCAALLFTCTVLGSRMKLRILAQHVLRAARRVFGIPDFRYYALSDGLAALLRRFPLHRQRFRPNAVGCPASPQLSLLPP